MFLIYSLLYAAVITILFFPQYLKRPKELRKKWLAEKFGRLPEAGPSIWVHAVSVGEVGAALPLLKKLRAAYPNHQLLLSTITDTGQLVAREKAPAGTTVIYLPFDLGFVLKRCVTRARPKMLIVIETELWPNLFRVLDKSGVPVIVLNGRISEKSSKGYAKISFFMKKVFTHVKKFGMQGEVDAGRLKKIGADQDKTTVSGNFKFDMDRPGPAPSWAGDIKGPVLVAGSTHKGEEEIIVSAFQENLVRFPLLRLIIAPRHPERFREAEEILKEKGLPFVKRSELTGLKAAGPLTPGWKVLLLDSVGELASVYGLADIAIIGKSFTGFGGQNPLEPAYWGKPIICGPHMENFPFIKDLYKEGAAFEVEAPSLAKKIKELLIEPEKAAAAGKKARELYQKNSGAVDRAMKIIREYLG